MEKRCRMELLALITSCLLQPLALFAESIDPVTGNKEKLRSQRAEDASAVIRAQSVFKDDFPLIDMPACASHSAPNEAF